MTTTDVGRIVTDAVRTALDLPDATVLRPNERLGRFEPDRLALVQFELIAERDLHLPANGGPTMRDPNVTLSGLVAQAVSLMGGSVEA